MPLATLSIDITAKLASLEKDMGRAAHIAEQNAKRMESAFKGASRALGAIGAALSVGAFASMVKGVADAGDELAKMSTRTGVAVEELSKLQYAASLSDVSNEDLANSLSRLNKVMGEAADGSKEATAALARFGIAPGSMTTLEAFQQIAERVKNTGDATKVASSLTDIFSKSYAQLIPLLKGGAAGLKESGDELERLGGVMSEDLARSSEAFNDNITKLNKSFDTLKIKLGSEIIPSLQKTTDAMSALAIEGKSVQALMRGFAGLGKLPWDMMLGDVDMSVSGQMRDLQEKLRDLETMRDSYAASGSRGGELQKNMLDQVEQQILITKNQIEAIEKYGDRIEKAANGFKGRSRITSFGPEITGTSTEPGKPKKEQKADLSQYEAAIEAEKAYFRAMEDIAKAQESARRSTLGLTAAQEKLLDLKQSPVWATLSEDQQRLADTQAKYADETIKASEAQQRLNNLIEGLPSSQIERAWQDMELLTKAVEAGKVSQTQYSEAVNRLFDGGADKIEKQKTLAEEFGLTFSSALEDAIVKGEEFSDVLEGIGKDILRLMARKNITEPLMEAFKSFSFNADGGVYASPGLSAYSGSIVSKPTIFPFANGIGLMGEAGAEAILPLKRGSSGSLGVSAEGMGGNVTVNVIESPGNGGQRTTRQGGDGSTIIDILVEQVENKLSSGVSRGSGPLPATMERVYGLNRASGAF